MRLPKSAFARAAAATLLLAVLNATLALALDRQPGADYRARRVALSKQLNGGVVVLFAALDPDNDYTNFRQENDFFYLTGWDAPRAALLIAPEVSATDKTPARPYTEILFLPTRNLVEERWTGVKLGPENSQAATQTGFDRVASLDQMHEELSKLLPQPRATIYTALAEAPATTPSSTPLEWLKRSNAFPNYTSFQDVHAKIAELRKHKDAGEIARIRHATEASMAAHRAAFLAMRPGLKEYQIAALMQYKFADDGCERPAYSPIVGAGMNSTILHYSDNTGEIRDGDLVVMDVAGEYAMYASDITRTVPANGHFSARQREIYDVVLGAQRAAMAAAKPGMMLTGHEPNSLYQIAYDYINTHGKDRHGEPLGKYFTHGLGHRVGLEVHDVGEGPLGTNEVFTIEPGIYIPEEKIGVRIEDIVMLDAQGKLINLTAALPHRAEEIEAAMQQQ